MFAFTCFFGTIVEYIPISIVQIYFSGGDTMSSQEKVVDRRLLYMIPALIAICMSFVSIVLQLGNKIIDIKNTCYYVYISVPVINGRTLSDEEFLEQTDKVIQECKVPGFTIVKNLQGGSTKDGKLEYESSYQIILMDISKKDVENFIRKLFESFNKSGALVEEVVMNSYYVEAT